MLADSSEGSSFQTLSPEERREIECYRQFFGELSQGELEEYASRCEQQDSDEIEARRPFNQAYAFADFRSLDAPSFMESG